MSPGAKTLLGAASLPAALVAVASLALAGGCGGETTSAPTRPPDIVVYLADTVRADHLELYGYERETAPRLTELARDGVVFTHARSTSSWTRPAVASLLTGVSPLGHGAILRSSVIRGNVRLAGEWLRDAGYRTLAVVTNPNVLPVWGFARGFDVFRDLEAVDGSARADAVNEAVFELLSDPTRSEPVFLYIHALDPHWPYQAPPPFDRSFPGPSADELASHDAAEAARARLADTTAAYDGEIRFLDHHFGELLDFLRRAGRYDDALILFTSDHGEEFLDHGGTFHGRTLFEEVVRVPLVVKLPRAEGGGRRVETAVSLLDVLPTVLAAAGVPMPTTLEGRDLAPLARRAAAPAAPRPVFLDLNQRAEAIVVDGHKLVRMRQPVERTLLFDLAADPHERRDLSAERPAVSEDLLARLRAERSRALAGVHLWLMNAPSQGERVCEAELSSEGRFARLATGQLEEGDSAALLDEGRRLHVSVRLENRRNPTRELPRYIVDHERIRFRLEPADAPFRLESVQCDGAPLPVFLGAAREPAEALPLTFDPAAPRLRVARMDRLLSATGTEISSRAPMGAYLGVVPPPEVAAITPGLEKRLDALGYAREQ